MAKSTKKAVHLRSPKVKKPKPKLIGWGIDQAKYDEARKPKS